MTRQRTPTRHRKILDLLSDRPEVSVSELSTHFGVTTMTIRRDLDQLEQRGQVRRVHGGAVLAAPSVVAFSFQERRQTHLPEKEAVARAAAGMLEPGMTVIMDTGTTTLEVASAMGGIPDLRVLTTSLAIASRFLAHRNVELILLGGTLNQNSPDLYGGLTQDNLRRFRADLAIIGADSANSDGLYTDSQEIAAVSHAMIASSERTILVADSSKFGRVSFVRFATWDEVDTVVVDEGLPASHRSWLTQRTELVLAE